MMKIEKKVFLEPEDDVNGAIGHLRDTAVTTVILNIPRNSVLGKSVANFELLKNEAKSSGKEVSIESVDEHILQLAAVAGFRVFNPVFRRGERAVADILPRPMPAIRPAETLPASRQAKPKPEPEFQIPPKPVKRAKPAARRRLLKTGIVAILVVISAAAAFIFLPRVDINIMFRQDAVDFRETVEAGKDIFEAAVKDEKILLPAELLTAAKNLEMKFPATDREQVELKAKGKLTVYNAYSSAPQTLVAATRFLSPDGKIFRLDKQVIVPGAKVVGGKIEPSSITVNITADKAGKEYNLEPNSEIWRIPGFQGSDRYEGFYAIGAESFSGGFVGERAVPADEDIEKAKAIVETALRDALKSQMLAVEENLKFLGEAAIFKMTKTEVNEIPDENDQFSVFTEAEMRQIGFNEEILKNALIDKFKNSLQANLSYGLELKRLEFEYSEVETDINKGIVSFSVSGRVSFVPSFDSENFRKEIIGLSEEELRLKTYGVPGLERARIVFWPFWVHGVPTRENRVLVSIE